MNTSRMPVPLDDEETIKRFTEAIQRRSASVIKHTEFHTVSHSESHTEVFSSHSLDHQTDKVKQVKDKATQTKPVTIINLSTNEDEDREPVTTGLPTNGMALEQAKLKNPALESVVSQSPHVSGVLAPPSTPETIPNYEISQLIADAINNLPPEAFTSLSESRYAPRRPFRSSNNTASSTTANPIYGSLRTTSRPDLKAKERSFARMSFKAADSGLTPTNHRFPDSVFIPDVQSSKWADKSPKPISSASTNPTTPHAEPNPFHILSDHADEISDEKSDDSVGASGSMRSEIDEFKKPVALKQGAGENRLPPHLRGFGKASGVPNTTDAEFAQVADKLNLLDFIYEPAYLKDADEKPIDSRVPLAVNAPNDMTRLQPAFSMKSESEIGEPASRPVSPVNTSDLTQSSVEFNLASPPKGVSGSVENIYPEGTLFLKAWPKVEKTRPVAEVRSVTLTGISSLDPKLVASLVFGGALESIYVKARSAVVMFLRGEDCKKYYEATPNGVHYKKNGKEGDAFVEIGDQVDVIGGRLLSWIGKGFTRCVRAVGVKSDITPAQLEILAQDQKRRVEGIEDGKTATGLRSVTFRFCDIRHAVTFKSYLDSQADWEHCNIHYSDDPCEVATGPHFS